MIRSCMAALLLIAAISAQDTHAPKVRIVFPEGVQSKKASMTYGLLGPTGEQVFCKPDDLTTNVRVD